MPNLKPKLLVLELWGLGDLCLATPFLRAASKRFEVTLLAKPTALELQPQLWPKVEVISFVFPWTAFKGKYILHRWPWQKLVSLVRELRMREFDAAVSVRWDPRDHFFLSLTGARKRLGFSRLGSSLFLTDPLLRPALDAHRYEYWQVLAQGLSLDSLQRPQTPLIKQKRLILIHSGAAQPIRVWPLERFQSLAKRLRDEEYHLQIICDTSQRGWWSSRGEEVSTPTSISELIKLLANSDVFVGNDSGPGHLAAVMGLPTFTIFGNNVPERIAPLHRDAEWIKGQDCAYKPCFDTCRFAEPKCLINVSEEEVWQKLHGFLKKHYAK